MGHWFELQRELFPFFSIFILLENDLLFNYIVIAYRLYLKCIHDICKSLIFWNNSAVWLEIQTNSLRKYCWFEEVMGLFKVERDSLQWWKNLGMTLTLSVFPLKCQQFQPFYQLKCFFFFSFPIWCSIISKPVFPNDIQILLRWEQSFLLVFSLCWDKYTYAHLLIGLPVYYSFGHW